MASARLYCTFLLLYLQHQGIQGQQVSGSNQNVGTNNNAMMLQQQTMQRVNAPNANHNQNGGANFNYQQPNFQQGNMQQQPNFQQGNMQQQPNFQQGNMQQQPNFQQGNMQQQPNFQQGNMQQAANFQGNMQQQQAQGAPSPFNVQVIRQQPSQPDVSVGNPKLGMAPQGAANPGLASLSSLQFVGGGISNNQAIPPQNMGPANIPMTQITNMPLTAPSYAESMKNQPSLLSLIGPQNNFASNQQVYPQNPIPPQNQLTESQKQMLVRSLQTQQPVTMQNQLGFNPVQYQPRMENQQYSPVQSQQVASYQPAVSAAGNQPAFITVQAQPLSSYLQNQYIPVEDEEASLMSLILSQLQPSSPQYAIASAYASPKKGKSSLKTLIPLIINLIKERNGCGCRNCGYQNGCGNNNEEPTIFGGYSNQKNYSERTEESLVQNSDVELENTANVKEKNSFMDNVVRVDSVEAYSGENDSEYVDDEDT